MFNEQITKIGNALGLEGKFLVGFGFEQIMAIIAPPPEMEDVDVTSWAIIAPSGFIETTSINEELQQGQVANENSPYYGYRVVKLAGTYQRVKPKPVERSVSVEVLVTDGGSTIERVTAAATHGAPFRGHSEISGKEGILTFTYTE